MKTTTQKQLTCPCGATARDTSKERGRFLRRHRYAAHPALDHPDMQPLIAEHVEIQKRLKAEAEAKAAAQKGAK